MPHNCLTVFYVESFDSEGRKQSESTAHRNKALIEEAKIIFLLAQSVTVHSYILQKKYQSAQKKLKQLHMNVTLQQKCLAKAIRSTLSVKCILSYHNGSKFNSF